MPDELARQLSAFGKTLEARAGGAIMPASAKARASRPAAPRTWAMWGAAACLVAGVGALVLTNRTHDDPAPQASAESNPESAATTIPSTTTTTLTTTTMTTATIAELVPDDPLALERDGWTLVQRDIDRFSFPATDVPCPAAAGMTAFDGIGEVHDVVTPPDAQGLDVDVQVLGVGSPDRGNDLSAQVLAIGSCLADSEGIEVTTSGNASMGATWFRAGPDFALITIVGPDTLSIVLEIEGAPFGDEVITDLVTRSAQFLRGA
jgi:hypothetical protein